MIGIFILSAFLSFTASKWVSGTIRNGVLETAKILEPKVSEISKQEHENLQIAQLLKEKSEKLWWLTALIGLVEFSFFFSLTFNRIQTNPLPEKLVFNDLPAFVAGWLAIKVVGNFSQWSNALIGRGLFYGFLCGTLTSIGLAIISAIVARRFV